MRTKKKLNFNRALVIGPSGIGNAHIRQYAKNKINKIAILGKSFKTKRILNFRFCDGKDGQYFSGTTKNMGIENYENINEIVEKKFLNTFL